MLRRVCAIAGECSYARSSASQAKVLLTTRPWRRTASILVPKEIWTTNAYDAWSVKHFSTSLSRQGKEKDVESSDQQDPSIRLLSLLMRKRELLLARADAQSNIDVAKDIRDLDELNGLWKEWQKCNKSITNLLSMSSPESEPDEEMRSLALEEAESVIASSDELRRSIRERVIPTDAVDEESAIVEVRTGIGGDESALFVGEVARMYTRYCEGVIDEKSGLPKFSIEELSSTPIDAVQSMEAFREVILQVNGPGAYGLLRNEAGIHRVQRVPATQKAIGKMHSSTIAVLVLPGGRGDQDGVNETTKDDVVDPKDVKTEVMRSRGAGGQHVNKTESAIRLTHEPTGITVSMQDSRSQHQNRVKAWAILRARLQDRKMREEQSQNRDARRTQMGSMDRGDRIRTYNFPQDRVTDHRVSISSNNITEVMNGSHEGGLQYLIDEVKQHQEQLILQALLAQAQEDIVQLEKKSS